MIKLTRVFFIIITALVLVSCASSPTGRRQVLLFSPGQVSQLGVQTFAKMKQEVPIEHDLKINHYVSCIANSITRLVDKEHVSKPWEVVVFKKDDVNAFALPGRKIGVYKGMLKVANSPDKLATVIGHEVAHVLSQHGNERMSQSAFAKIGLSVADAAIGTGAYHDAAMSALGMGVQVGVLLPFSRTHESEADILGLVLMARAGFDPQASVTLWQDMAARSKGKQPIEMLSTHPANSTRIKDLRAAIASLPKYNVVKPKCN